MREGGLLPDSQELGTALPLRGENSRDACYDARRARAEGFLGVNLVAFTGKEDRMALKEFAGLFWGEALDEKTRQLVALAAMTAAGCYT